MNTLLGAPALWGPPGWPSLPPLWRHCLWVGVLRVPGGTALGAWRWREDLLACARLL